MLTGIIYKVICCSKRLRVAGVDVEQKPQCIKPHGTTAIGDELLGISERRQIIHLSAGSNLSDGSNVSI